MIVCRLVCEVPLVWSAWVWTPLGAVLVYVFEPCMAETDPLEYLPQMGKGGGGGVPRGGGGALLPTPVHSKGETDPPL